MTRLRGRLNAVDPLNLNQIILAEGKEITETKTRFSTKVLAEIIVFSALSAALYIIRPFSMPFGGAVTLGSMVPVMWLSMRRGIYAGIIAGILFGIMALLIDIVLLPYSPIATPIQAVLEYPIAFGFIGLAGIFHKKTVAFAMAGVAISVLIKFLVHYFVGVLIWYHVYEFPAFGQYVYPAVYNGLFLVPEFIISAILIGLLVKRGTLKYEL